MEKYTFLVMEEVQLQMLEVLLVVLVVMVLIKLILLQHKAVVDLVVAQDMIHLMLDQLVAILLSTQEQ